MTHVHKVTHFDIPVERVFDLVMDFKRYPEWSVNYTEIREVVGPPREVGTRVHAVMRLLGRTMEGWGEIIEIDPPRLLKFRGTSTEGGGTTTSYRLTPAGTGTDVELDLDYELPAGIFGKIVDRLFIERAVDRDLEHSIENFKALLEVRQPALA